MGTGHAKPAAWPAAVAPPRGLPLISQAPLGAPEPFVAVLPQFRLTLTSDAKPLSSLFDGERDEAQGRFSVADGVDAGAGGVAYCPLGTLLGLSRQKHAEEFGRVDCDVRATTNRCGLEPEKGRGGGE